MNDTHPGDRIIDEAAACVGAALGPTNWFQRYRLRKWATRSSIHAQEFLLLSMISEGFRRIDPKRAIDIEELVEQADRTVVPLSGDDPVLSKPVKARADAAASRSPARPTPFEQCAFGERRSNLKLRTAVALILLPTLPLLAPSAPLPTLSEFATGQGETRTITLQSGSVINLNELSSVRIEHHWGGYDVALTTGEAYFSIRHNTVPHLAVVAANTLVEDIGTRFDLRLTSEGATLSVLEGRVTIRGMPHPSDDEENVDVSHAHSVASPNPVATLADAGTEVSIHRSARGARLIMRRRALADMEHDSVWTKGWLLFDGETLAEVARIFNARNRRQIVLADPSVATIRIGGRFLAADVESSIAALTRTLPIQVLSDGGDGDRNTIRLARADNRPVRLPRTWIPDTSVE